MNSRQKAVEEALAVAAVLHDDPKMICHPGNHLKVLAQEVLRLRPIAKAEQLDLCDPNGTWYDVAQDAMGVLRECALEIKRLDHKNKCLELGTVKHVLRERP